MRAAFCEEEVPIVRARAAKDGSPLTIGFFAPYERYGGTEEYLEKLMRPVADMGYRVVFFYRQELPRDWIEKVGRYAETVAYDSAWHGGGSNGLQQRGGGAKGLLWESARRLHRRFVPRSGRFVVGFAREALRMRRVFMKWPVDVLHFSDLGADPQILAARLACIPRLTGALGCLPRSGPLRSSWPYRFLEALCLSSMDAVAAVSKRGRSLWLRRTRMNPRKIQVVYTGTEVVPIEAMTGLSEEVRGELGIPLDAGIVGVSAGLVRLKGHAYLLAAFPDVLKAVPDAWLVLAGDGPARAELEQQARDLGISERVLFLGHRQDIKRIVQAYDIIALPSVDDSMPFSLLEGMSLAKPVVASAVGGIPELVEDGVTGYLVPPRDPVAVAEALINVLKDRATAARMGMAARERVRSRFNVERMVRETVAMMLGRRGKGRRRLLK